nr:hypothetical protein [Tanacetum cinerariifolium]
MTESHPVESDFNVHVSSLGDDLIACLNKEMAFLTAVAFSRFPSTNNQLRTSSNTRNQATIQYRRVNVQQVQGRQRQSYFGIGYKSNASSFGRNNTKDLDTYDSDSHDILNAKAVLMANISNYGSDVYSETYLNDMENQKKEAKNIENEIDLEKKIQELDNIIFKVGQSAHTVDMLTKPQAQLQDKDTTIYKLKDIIKSMKEKSKDENVNYDYVEIETNNVELENSVAKLILENERLCNKFNHVKKELLVYVRDTCPNAINLSAKKVAVIPKNNVKKVRLSRLFSGISTLDARNTRQRTALSS